MIKGLHHNAYRCRDSEETRAFYEDFLGLRFVSAFEIDAGRGRGGGDRRHFRWVLSSRSGDGLGEGGRMDPAVRLELHEHQLPVVYLIGHSSGRGPTTKIAFRFGHAAP